MSTNTVIMEKCSGCIKPLPQREFMRCSVCNSAYDLECINMSNTRYYSFYALDKERKGTWKCPHCLSKQRKCGNLNSPVRHQTCEPAELPSPVADDIENVTLRRNTKVFDKNALNDSDQCDLTNSKEEIKLFLDEMRAARLEISLFRSTVADLTATIKAQNIRIDGLETRVEFLESTLREPKDNKSGVLEDTIQQLKLEIQERDQQILMNDIEISNLPETSNENCTHIAIAVAKKIGVELEERDVVNVERVGPMRAYVEGSPAPRPRPLVVRLTRRSVRDELLRAARVRRGTTTDGLALPGGVRSFYVNERLTKPNRQLFQKTREAAHSCTWKYVWTRDGKIFARQDQGKPRHRVRSDQDIAKVFGISNVSVNP